MKNNLGRLAVFLIFPLLLLADSNLATYTLDASSTNVVTKEAVLVTCKVHQIDHSNGMYFFLKPKKNEKYKLIFLNETTTDITKRDTTSIFKFLLFPLKEGDITIDFNLSVQIADVTAFSDFYTGANENIKMMDAITKQIPIKPLHFHVNPLVQKVDLVGDFTLKSELQKNKINQNGAANIRYTLQGRGYEEDFKQPLGPIAGVTAFSQITNESFKSTPNGNELKREFAYALTSNKSFTIPSLEVKAYSPKLKKYYSLKTQDYNINVSSIDPATLLDKKDSPQAKTLDFTWIKQFAIAVAIFLAGFISAKLQPSFHFKREKKERFSDIKKATSAKELILVLMQNYAAYNIKEFIDELEALEYKKSGKNFKDLKTKLLKKLM
jgi:BatD DUF11 like domain